MIDWQTIPIVCNLFSLFAYPNGLGHHLPITCSRGSGFNSFGRQLANVVKNVRQLIKVALACVLDYPCSILILHKCVNWETLTFSADNCSEMLFLSWIDFIPTNYWSHRWWRWFRWVGEREHWKRWLSSADVKTRRRRQIRTQQRDLVGSNCQHRRVCPLGASFLRTWVDVQVSTIDHRRCWLFWCSWSGRHPWCWTSEGGNHSGTSGG